MRELTTDERISLGQCLNLAHNEAIRLDGVKDRENLAKLTKELFHLKNRIQRELMEELE